MVQAITGGCEILTNEPERFVVYLLANPKIRKEIYDKDSFVQALEKVLKADPTLKNILDDIKSKGKSLENCSSNMFDSSQVRQLVKNNLLAKRREIRQRIRKDKPTLKGKKFEKEVVRRLNIAIGVSKQKIMQTKQITISESLTQAQKPIRVGSYDRKGKTVGSYRKSKYKSLTKAEEMLIKNNIQKKPKEIIKKYYEQGWTFRSKTSLIRHIQRLRKK